MRKRTHKTPLVSPWLFTLLCGLLLWQQEPLFAEESDSVLYRLHLHAFAGPSMSRIERSTTVDKAEYSRSAYAFSLRCLVQPNHLLAIGVETSYLQLSSMTVKADATLPEGSTMSLNAIPLLCIFSMEKYGVELSAGVGAYSYRAQLLAHGVSTTSSEWEIGWNAAAAYRFELFKNFYLGAEARVYVIPERSVSLSTAGLRIQYQLYY